MFRSTFAPVPQNDHIEIRNESRSQPLERCNAKSTSRLICIILFVFGERFGKAQRAERCGASVKRCNAAKRRQNQPLRAGTVSLPPHCVRTLDRSPATLCGSFLVRQKTVSGKMVQIKRDVL
ncbi:hypothetical protein THPR109532_17040 [Thalassospira profundimaris]